MHKIVILGPQGSGKGTQAALLAKKLHIPAISAGGLLRDEKASGSDLGKTIASHIDQGQLVPDEIMSQVLQKRLANDDARNGFVLDGFPRFLEQYESSKAFLKPTAVLVVGVPKDESIRRIMKRASVERRDDDTPEKIEERLKWNEEKTEPVIEKFREEGIAHSIDGMGTIEEVSGRIEQALGI